ncbi:cytochrome d ubiquinol oxidase subunit II [soil metagenome]
MTPILGDYPFEDWLPVAFVVLMGISILVYVVLDGFDLGVGILSRDATDAERDVMIGSIGPFWDANETWLVLAVGILLTAFPIAHGQILVALYIPATLMLIALILRGVAFEFRAKSHAAQKGRWDLAFFAGSFLAALTQGYMLGVYVLGLAAGWAAFAFGLLTGICLAAGYAFIGACWLILKTEGALQMKAIGWARRLIWIAAIGMAAISLATPFASPWIFEKWFGWPQVALLAPIPVLTGGIFVALVALLAAMPFENDRWAWAPFALGTLVFLLGFLGMAYSFFPYVVPDRLTAWDAAAARESLFIIFVGAIVMLPIIGGYSIFAYWVFRGKATALRYE